MHEIAELKKQIELLTHAIMVKQDTVPHTFSELVRDQTKKFEMMEERFVEAMGKQDDAHKAFKSEIDDLRKQLEPLTDLYKGSKWISWFVIIIIGTIGTIAALKSQISSLWTTS